MTSVKGLALSFPRTDLEEQFVDENLHYATYQYLLGNTYPHMHFSGARVGPFLFGFVRHVVAQGKWWSPYSQKVLHYWRLFGKLSQALTNTSS